MQEKWIRPVLYVSGIVTMLAGLQFIAPSLVLKTSGVPVTEVTGLFYAQHWALMAFVVGALLVYVARHAEARRAVMLAAGVEKLGIVVLLAMQWSEPELQGLHVAALFDAACVLLFSVYLLRA